MPQFRNFNYDVEEVTAIETDLVNGSFLWIAFEQDASGNCKLYKVSANDPDLVYFVVNVPVDRINRMKVEGTSIYLAVSDSTNFAYKYSVSNPLTSFTAFAIPSGITEAPIDIGISSSHLNYLTPGSASSTPPKIVRITTSTFVIDEIIEIEISGETIEDASSITVSSADNMWIVTKTSPTKLVRIYEGSGGLFFFDTNEIV